MIDHLGDIYFWTVFYAFCKIEGLSCKLFKILWYPLKFFCRYLKFIYIFFTIFWESNNFWVWPTFVSVLHSNITGLKIFVFFPLPIYKKKNAMFYYFIHLFSWPSFATAFFFNYIYCKLYLFYCFQPENFMRMFKFHPYISSSCYFLF